jgi:hypothetical protein
VTGIVNPEGIRLPDQAALRQSLRTISTAFSHGFNGAVVDAFFYLNLPHVVVWISINAL